MANKRPPMLPAKKPEAVFEAPETGTSLVPAKATGAVAMGEALIEHNKAKTAAKAAKKAKEVLPWQEGKRQVNVWVDEVQYRRINDMCYELRIPIRQFFEEALDRQLLAYSGQPIRYVPKDPRNPPESDEAE